MLTTAPDKLMYDAEWLAILKETNQLTTINRGHTRLPTPGLDAKFNYSVNEPAINNVR